MDHSNGRGSPDFTIVDDHGKGKVKRSHKARKFRVNDTVYVTVNGVDEGPYVIEKAVEGTTRYTLCYADGSGRSARNGQEIEEHNLKSR
ncbi:hypothetical protein G7054_g4949 [Neopestalotiopsis clavispora]|nr:hypothetical protein G7054_g4949 [Neopestalotiopsis clavispora]